jgi:hypothetical protein
VELTEVPKSGGRRKKGRGSKKKMGPGRGEQVTTALSNCSINFFKSFSFFIIFFGAMRNFLAF